MIFHLAFLLVSGNAQRNGNFPPAAALKQFPSVGFFLRYLIDVAFHEVLCKNHLQKILACISHPFSELTSTRMHTLEIAYC